MRVAPCRPAGHLDSGATTLCRCWRITRRDGVVLGFTDHDRDLVFDGTTFEAASGFDRHGDRDTRRPRCRHARCRGALRSDRLNAADLAAGLYDDAEIEIWRVNWQDAEPARADPLGLDRRGAARAARLSRPRCAASRMYLQQPSRAARSSIACDADLGDGRCGIDLDRRRLSRHRRGHRSRRRPAASRSPASAPSPTDWFTRGSSTWTIRRQCRARGRGEAAHAAPAAS